MPKLIYQDGLKLAEREFEMPPPATDPGFSSCYVFALPKAGSVLLNNITSALMRESGIPVVDLPGFCFGNGIAIDALLFEIDQIFRPKGYCYSGFRIVPLSLQAVLTELSGKKILMVRDPRDMLVSSYYSHKFSHRYPDAGTAQFFARANALRNPANDSIDSYCFSIVEVYLRCFRDYSKLVDNSEVKILRYEDVVFDKLSLARTIRDWFSLDIPSARLNELVAPFDILPMEDRPHEHIRQVHPGDHKRKLRPATIEGLNATLEKFLRRFDYSI